MEKLFKYKKNRKFIDENDLFVKFNVLNQNILLKSEKLAQKN